LFNLLIEKTKSKRGYSTCGGILTHLLSTLAGTYPFDTQFVNSEEWKSPGQNGFVNPRRYFLTQGIGFDANHNLYWGRMYSAKDVKIDWHGGFHLEICDRSS
jgi:proteasome activator subunit 4